jgi:Ca-activated chloride channel family protein
MNPLRFHLLGYPVGFGKPIYGLLVLLSLVIGVLALYYALKRRQRLLATINPRIADRLAPGVSVARPATKAVLYSIGLLLFGIALAQPQCGSHTETTKRKGIDVVVALDVSNSMLAQDVQPSRLERAKLELLTLLDELKGDRVGIVLFAGDAFIQCPLTSDYAAARLFLKEARPEQMQQGGTNIGAALDLAKKVFDGAERGSKDRVVVLLSDGEDVYNEFGTILDDLKEAGVRIYAVGIGSDSGVPIPIFDRTGNVAAYKKDRNGQTVLTRLDRAGLLKLAEATDGEFFYQPKQVAMGDVVKRIDQLQKSELESRVTVRYDERYQSFAFPGLALLFIGMMIAPSRRKVTT